ncbi:MAG: hypothetical protein IJ141_08345 [Lachnospiraceae bacterium]|nr:hypothetical protein [Lachnospiraceae bacterium]
MLKKNKFLEKYNINNSFLKASNRGLTWRRLSEIYDDYSKNYYKEYNNLADDIVERIYKNAPVEAKIVYGRAKDPEHLIEKIIRKIGDEDKPDYYNINVKNYRKIVTDLIGIRILILKKEDWDVVDNHIHRLFKKFKEPPVAYVCYGDRDIYGKNRINTEYTNKGYRSQHYTALYKNNIYEIQVRTLAEEVYGEYDHKIRYPYRTNSNFLARYNRIIAKVTSELDDLISTSLTMNSDSIDKLDDDFSKDIYRDWSREVDENMKHSQDSYDIVYNMDEQDKIKAKDYIVNRIIRKGR